VLPYQARDDALPQSMVHAHQRDFVRQVRAVSNVHHALDMILQPARPESPQETAEGTLVSRRQGGIVLFGIGWHNKGTTAICQTRILIQLFLRGP
jgi:hypothetical protein